MEPAKRSLLERLNLLSNSVDIAEDTVPERTYLAEALEARVMFSASPVDLPEQIEHSESINSTTFSDFESIDSFQDTGASVPTAALASSSPSETDDWVSLASLENLTEAELEALADAAAQRWEASGLSDEQLAALDDVTFLIADLDGPALGYAEGSRVVLDIDAAGKGWFVDSTPQEDSEFSGSTLGQVEGIDLLSVVTHEFGHILGLQDIYDASQATDVMYGLFDEGERRDVRDGQADGAEAGSLTGAHYAIWTGATDLNWNEATNWDTGVVPVGGEDAIFNSGGAGTPITIIIGGSVTVDELLFNNANTAAYTIGTTGDTIIIPTAADNGEGINVNDPVTSDITVNANIETSDTLRIGNRGTGTLTVNGDITHTATTNEAVNFGRFSTADNGNLIVMNGDLVRTSTGRLQLNVVGVDLQFNGNVPQETGDTNNWRTQVSHGSVLTVGSSSLIGNGNLTVQHGVLNLNNTTTAQLIDQGITLGNATGANGDAVVNLASGVTLLMNAGTTYVADDDTANTATISGGTINLDGADRTFTINNNALVTGQELNLATNFSASGAGSDQINFHGDGALLWNSTLDATDQVDRIEFNTQTTVIGANGTDFTNLERELFVRQRNNAAFSDFDVTLDINGQTLILDDDLIVSQASTNNVVTPSSTRIVDNTGGGLIRLTSDNDITYNAGTAGNLNVTAFVETDLQFEGSGFSFNVGDGADAVDLQMSGNILSDTGARTMVKSGTGTLYLTSAVNSTGVGVLSIQNGVAQIESTNAIGSDDIQLGNNTTSGTLEWIGGTANIDREIRIGDNTTGAGRVGGGAIINNGTGGLTFTTALFNSPRGNVSEARNLTLGGDNTGGDNIVQGTLADNGAAVGLTKTGSNTWSLEGANSYTGDTDIQAGRLNINGTIGGNLNVAAGATIGGEASFAGNATFGAGSTIVVDGSTPGAITAAGAVDTSAGVTISLTAGGSGDFVLLDFDPAQANNINVSDFTIDLNGITTSARLLASPTVTIDNATGQVLLSLGFEDRTWDNSGGTDVWENGLDNNNWVEGDEDFHNGDSVIFADDAGSDQTVTVTGGGVEAVNVTFTNDATNNYTISGDPITVTGTLTKASDNNVTINSVITGSGSLFVGDNDTQQDSSNDSLVLTAANTYTGGSVLAEGRISLTNSAALGTGLVTLNETSNTGSQSRDIIVDLDADSLNIGNEILVGDTGVKYFRLDNGGTTANTGTISGDITNNETGQFNFRLLVGGNDTLTVSGQVSGNGAQFLRNTDQAVPGTVIYTNAANDFTGRLTIATQVQVASISNSGVASHLGAGSIIVLGTSANATATHNNNSDGNLIYTGTGDSTDKQIQIGSRWFGSPIEGANGGAITNNGSGALVFTSNTLQQTDRGNVDIGPRTLTLAGSYTGTNEFNGVIQDNAPNDSFVDETVGVTVNTSGTWQLGGANTYTGTTTVSGGTLQLTGSTAAGSAVTVQTGGTLSGTGTVNGTTTIDSGGTLSAGTGGIGTLNLADTVVNGTLAIEVDGTGGGTTDLLSVNGNLDITNATLSVSELTTADDAAYIVATWTGTLTGSAFAAETIPAGYTVVVDNALKQIRLEQATTPSITTLSPADNSTNVPAADNLAVTFDQNMAIGTGNITLTADVSSFSNTIHDESTIDGDLSGNLYTPTVLNLRTGSNKISGNVGGSATGGATNGTDADYFTITVPAGTQLTGINVDAKDGGSSFIGYRAGTSFTGQGAGDIDGNTLFNSGSGDIITALAGGSLGPGTYSFWVQETSGSTNYTLSYELTPDAVTIDVTDSSQVSVAGAVVTINPTNDLLSSTPYSVQIDPGALTNTGGSAFAGISDNTTWNFTTANTAPDIIGGAAVTELVREDIGAGVIFLDVNSTDDRDTDASGLTYAFSTDSGGGTDNGLFSITSQGFLSFQTLVDFENPSDANTDNTYEVQVTVTDSNGDTDIQNISVNVINRDATIILTSPSAQNEGNSGTTGYNFTLTRTGDTTGVSTVNYTVAGIGANPAAAADFDGGSFPTGTVTFADGETSKTVTINVAGDTDIEPDEDFELVLSSPTNATPGFSRVLDVETTEDTASLQNGVTSTQTTANASLTLSPTGGVGGSRAIQITTDSSTTPDPATLGLDLGGLSAVGFDYVELQLQSTGSNENLTVSLLDASGTAIATGATVQTSTLSGSYQSYQIDLSTVGATPIQTLLFSFADIDGGTASILVDNLDAYLLKTFTTITNDDANTAPVITGGATAAVNFAENTAITTEVINLATTDDSDSEGSGLTYSFSTNGGGGADNSLFAIDSTTGALTFLASPDFENPTDNGTNNVYDVQITVTDSGSLTDFQDIVVTVTNVDASLSIADLTQNEGDTGNTSFSFTVTRTGDTTGTSSAAYTVSGTTATAGTDFTAVTGTVTFADGVTTQTINVDVSGDTDVEADETFQVVLSSATNAVFTDDTAVGTITNDDTFSAEVSIAATTDANEAGSVAGQFTLTQTAAAGVDTVIAYNVAVASTATDGGTDYTTLSGTVTILAGSTTATIDVTGIVDDNLIEGDETVTVTLDSITSGDPGVSIATGAGSGTGPVVTLITDADLAGDGTTSINVGGGGLSQVANPIYDNFSTGTGQGDTWGGAGLVIGGNTVTFTNVSMTDVNGSVAATGPQFIADGNGMGIRSESTDTQSNGDGEQPWHVNEQEAWTWTADADLAFAGVSFRAGWQGGGGNKALTVSSPAWVGLTGVTTGTGITYNSANGSFEIGNTGDGGDGDAVTLDELVGVGGPSLILSAGTQISFSNTGSGVGNAGGFALTSVSFASVNPTNEATVTIVDNDIADFTIAATDAVKSEGDSGTTNYDFTITRTGDTTGAASVEYTVTSANADATDFGGTLPTDVVVNFAANETSKVISISVSGDTTVEGDEAFTVTLNDPSTGHVIDSLATGASSAIGTITNDDIADVNPIDWDGTGADNLWSNFLNWVPDNQLPNAGDTINISNGDTAEWDISSINAGGFSTANGNLPNGSTINLTGGSDLAVTTSVIRLNGSTINVGAGSTLSGGFWDLNNGTLVFEDGADFTAPNFELKGSTTVQFNLGATGFTTINANSLRQGGGNVFTDETFAVDMTNYTGGAATITLMSFSNDTVNMDNTAFQTANLSVTNVPFGYAGTLQWNDATESIELVVTSVLQTTVYVDDDWTAGTFTDNSTDADAGTTGGQTAVFGVTAFNNIADAIAATAAGGTIIVNSGVYAETVALADGKKIEITGPDTAQTVEITELSSVAGTEIILEGSSRLYVDNTANQEIAGVISGSGSLGKLGTGELTLSGTNTYTGGTRIGDALSGTPRLGGPIVVTNNSSVGTGQIVFERGGSLNVAADGLTFSNSILVPNWGSGVRTIALDEAGANTVTFTGNIDLRRGTAGEFVLDAGTDDTINLTGNIFTGAGGGSGITKNGDGTAVLSGNNTYVGTTTIAAGILQIDSATGISSGNITFTGGTLQYTSNSAATDHSAQIVNSTSPISIDTNGQNVTYATTLATSNNGGLTKEGAGTLQANIDGYTGATIVNGGQLTLANVADLRATSSNAFFINNASTLEIESSVGSGNRTVLNNDVFTFDSAGGGTLHFNGGNHLLQGASANHGIVTNGGATNNVTASNNAFLNMQGPGRFTFDVADGSDAQDLVVGVRVHNGDIIKNGAGTLALTNTTNSLGASNNVDINAGTVEISGGGRLDSGAFAGTITNDGAFIYNSTATQTLSGVVSGTGSVELASSSTLTLSGNSTYTGSTTVSAGTLVVTGDNSSATGSVTVAAGATLAGTGTLGGAVTVADDGILAPGVSGVGTLTIANNLSLNGDLQVEVNGVTTAGTDYDQVAVNGTVTLGATSTLVATGSTGTRGDVTIIANDATDTVTGTFVGSGLAEGDVVTINGQNFNISYVDGTDSNDVVLGVIETTAVIDGSGNLVITDVGTDSSDTITITDDGTNFIITNSEGGFSQTIPISSVTGGLVIQSAFTADEATDTGADTVNLNTSHSFAGPITVTADTINLLANVDANSNDVALNGNVTLGAATTITANDLSISGTVALGANNLTVNVGGTGSTITGIVSGSASLIKEGSGELILSSQKSYTGTTEINNGTFDFHSTAGFLSLVGGDVNINNGSTLQFTRNGGNGYVLDAADTINFGSGGGGTLEVLGGLNFVVRGATFTTSGGAANTIQGGSLNMDNSGPVNFTVAAGTDPVDLIVSSVLQNAQGIQKTGAGTMSLTGNNTYDGTTDIQAGTLIVDGVIGNDNPAGTVTIASGATLSGGGTVNAPIAGTSTLATITATGNLNLGDGSGTGFSFGGTLNVGTHTVTINDSNTATAGDITITGGTLTAANGVTLSGGDVIEGTGTIDIGTGTAGLITNSGSLAPGDESGDKTGTLTVDGDLDADGGTLILQVDGVTAGDFDQIVVNGAVDITGATLDTTGSTTTSAGNIVLISNDGSDAVIGQFTGLANGSTVTINGQSFTINYAGGDGNDVVLESAFPEINVKDSDGDNIASGDTASTLQNTNFGIVAQDTSPTPTTYDQTFTIENLGGAPLDLTGAPLVSITGGSNFTIQTQPTVDPIGVSGSTTFTVRFTPSTLGVQTATITIANNDADEGTYTFQVSGEVHPVSQTFDGGAGNTNWTDAGNWNNDFIPGSNQTGSGGTTPSSITTSANIFGGNQVDISDSLDYQLSSVRVDGTLNIAPGADIDVGQGTNAIVTVAEGATPSVVNQTGGDFSFDQLRLGRNADATFNLSGGTANWTGTSGGGSNIHFRPDSSTATSTINISGTGALVQNPASTSNVLMESASSQILVSDSGVFHIDRAVFMSNSAANAGYSSLIQLTGSDARFDVGDLDAAPANTGSSATLGFVADASGFTTIVVDDSGAGNGNVTLSAQTALNVDLTAIGNTNPGSAVLIDYDGALTGTFGSQTITHNGTTLTLAASAPAGNDPANLAEGEYWIDYTTNGDVTLFFNAEEQEPVATNDTTTAGEAGSGVAGIDPTGDVTGGPTQGAGDVADTDPQGQTISVTQIAFGTNSPVTVTTGGATVAGAFGSLTINPDGTYTYAVDQVLADGLSSSDSVTEVFSYTIEDTDGNSATATLTVNVNGADDSIPDTTAPSPTIVGPTSTPSDQPVNLTISFGEPVTGLTASDLQVSGGTVTGLIDNGDGTFTVTITPSGSTSLTVDIPAGAVADLAGNTSQTASTYQATVTSPSDFVGVSSVFGDLVDERLFTGIFQPVVSSLDAEDESREPRIVIAGDWGDAPLIHLSLYDNRNNLVYTYVENEILDLVSDSNGRSIRGVMIPWQQGLLNATLRITIEGIQQTEWPNEINLLEEARYPINLEQLFLGKIPGQIVGEVVEQL